MIDVNYSDFRQLLKDATSRNAVLRPSDTQRWQEYIKTNGINEFAAMAIARNQLQEPIPVVLQLGQDTDGLYTYSEPEERCVRLVFWGEV